MVSQLPGNKQCMNSDPHRLIAEPVLLTCLLFNHSYPWSNWSRKWQPTTAFLPGKLHGQRGLAGYSPWSPKESDTIEYTHPCNKRACINYVQIVELMLFLWKLGSTKSISVGILESFQNFVFIFLKKAIEMCVMYLKCNYSLNYDLCNRLYSASDI